MDAERELSVYDWIAARPELWRDCDGVSIAYTTLAPVPLSPGVYFLLSDDCTILYVGQTVNLDARLLSHRKARKIPFTRAAWLEVPKNALTALEAYHVINAEPPCNRKFVGMERECGLVEDAIERLAA